ncbi:MAG: hypothetical protein JWO43_524 [Candidatus Adlerbacteria bacterium]|nr:hypothetical protein [Candidatus Adlerbacteria bacterium]
MPMAGGQWITNFSGEEIGSTCAAINLAVHIYLTEKRGQTKFGNRIERFGKNLASPGSGETLLPPAIANDQEVRLTTYSVHLSDPTKPSQPIFAEVHLEALPPGVQDKLEIIEGDFMSKKHRELIGQWLTEADREGLMRTFVAGKSFMPTWMSSELKLESDLILKMLLGEKMGLAEFQKTYLL